MEPKGRRNLSQYNGQRMGVNLEWLEALDAGRETVPMNGATQKDSAGCRVGEGSGPTVRV